MGINQEIIDLHEAIINAIQQKYQEYTVGDYESYEETIPTPGIFINLSEFEEIDIGNGLNKDHFTCHFEAYICFSFNTPNVKLELRQAALALASFIKGNRWNNNAFQKARNTHGLPDEFNPKFEAVEVWRIEWEQIIAIQKPV